MIASKGLRPALLFFASSGVSTTASISARKLSHGTSAVIASSGSPFSDNAASRLSASKNPSCPIARSAESRPHERDSHSTKRQPIIRGALISFRLRLPLRLGPRIADRFRQHLAQFSLGLRRYPRFLPLSHSYDMGMPEGELNPAGTPCG